MERGEGPGLFNSQAVALAFDLPYEDRIPDGPFKSRR